MEKKHIVVIDDEEHILELVSYNLEANDFHVSCFTSVEDALVSLENEKIDAILLDVMLPGINGMNALERFRKSSHLKDVPILLVTAKSEEIDKILGLELGADDYITKPFSVRELIARVRAAVRRNERQAAPSREEATSTLSFKGLALDSESHSVTYEGHPIELTFKEFEMLKLLMTNRGKVLTREVILDKVWGYDYYGETRTVDVHIRYLRSKLDTYHIGEYIETVRGVGYKFIKE
ncbi:DNA-binding response regulator [Sporanaerobium hydrogeniformans]|uniref:DNA-binding response regulator n=1 Tax=Sporanaerobium hydrogeniformans TaxID=3072179 RepID=A0AC61DCE3_9FIRM|nr:response regulator transcription factor [Sporanaerobium hydrogeniformans]PHV70341.1 DNA-binding response regulator [Sporanaerobium hydrogeniformans]